MTIDEIYTGKPINYKKEKQAIIILAKERLQYIMKNRRIHQADLGAIMHGRKQSTISKQLSLNTQTMPSFADIVLFCKLLNLDIRYLIYPDFDFEKAFFTKQERLRNIQIEFAETSVYQHFIKICTDCLTDKNIVLVSTVAKNGSTTVLKKFVHDNMKRAVYSNYFSAVFDMNEKIKFWFDIKEVEDVQIGKSKVLLFDDAELLKPEDVMNIIKHYHNELEMALVFLCKSPGYELRELIPNPKVEYTLESLLPEDIKQILLANIPDFPPNKFYLAESITGGNIYNLIEIIKFIKEEDSNTFSYDRLYEKKFT